MGEVEAKMRETGEEEHSNSMKKNESDCCEEVVRWDTILPRMVLRVLLVEADHSTRQIIAALLRKCSYKVTAVPDGLKAWETLKRKAPDLDLILTEVQLPAISGFALLTLVMEHDFCKNIPVIMMSSHDSVGMVLKCMLKGAADFLIKPVRRNELKNLWQHVWRRHALSRPPQDTTLPQKKLKTASEDNSASNQSSGSVASSQKNNECSEKLSEAQDASQLKSSSKFSNIDAVKREESTKFETESAKHDDETGEKSITFVLEAARCKKSFKSTDLRLEQYHGCTETENKNEVLRAKLSRANPNMNTAIHDQLVEPSRGAINLIATFDNLSKHTDENCSLSGADITKVDFDTQLELSLRRDSTGSSCKQGSEASVEWQILNHTNTSAFSWYSGGKLLQPFFPTPPIPSSKLNKKYDGSNQNQEKMTTSVTDQFGQVGPRLSNSHSGLFPGNGVTSDLQSKGHGNVFTSVFCAQSDVHPIWKRKPVCQKESSPLPTSNSSQLNPDATYTSLNQNVHDKSTLDHPRLDSPASGQCADDAIRVNSAYGSIDNGSDGNATSTVVDKNNPESFSDSGSHNYDTFRGTNSHHSSQREAALEKFRLKRKGRCYEKKVRYQSRKRLAEQRPRVKGQFVRQVRNDQPVTDVSADS